VPMKTFHATCAAAVCLAAAATTIAAAGPAAADPAACDPHALAVGVETAQPGLGHRAVQLTFALQPGAAACQLSGYPAVTAEPRLPGAAPIQAQQTPGGYLGGATPGAVVTLYPGQGARAMVEWVAGAGGRDQSCQVYGSGPNDVTLHVTPPGTAQSFDVPISVGRNEGLCMLQVHPVAGG
jgi:hypothetical protein